MGDSSEAFNPAARDDLQSLLRSGHFKRARALLGERSDSLALIERARLAFFLDNDFETTDLLAARAVEARDSTNGQRVLARIFRKCVAACRGSSLGCVIDASDLASVEPEMLAEVVYYAAYAAYFSHDLITAEYWLRSHRPDAPEWVARYLVVRGLIAAANDDFPAQANFTSQALDVLESRAPESIYLIANAARILAVLSRDISCVDAFARLERLLKAVGDDDGFTGSRFHVIRSLAWSHALSGRYPTAMRFVLRATCEATSDMQRLYAHLDQASIAVFAHEQRSASALAAYEAAREILLSIPWESVMTDDLAALPLASQVAAEFGAFDDAKRYCEMAAAGRGRMFARIGMAHDGRYDALVHEAVALAYASDDRRKSISAAADAYEAHKRLGFDWRAARMAILLYQMTHTPKWKSRALTHLEAYPTGPFHRILQRPRTLTKRQEDVLKLVRLGFDDHHIARDLGISYKTVRIHLGRLFTWYGVKSKSALMAKAAENVV